MHNPRSPRFPLMRKWSSCSALRLQRSREVLGADPRGDRVSIRILLRCSGKVIVLGIGKSGIIAQKIAQTLTSTGTAAVFVHPSDALHGSLGIISDGDAAIAVSNSGETEEIVLLLPALKRRNVPLIAVVGDLESTPARKADATLDASVEIREACPLDLDADCVDDRGSRDR